MFCMLMWQAVCMKPMKQWTKNILTIQPLVLWLYAFLWLLRLFVIFRLQFWIDDVRLNDEKNIYSRIMHTATSLHTATSITRAPSTYSTTCQCQANSFNNEVSTKWKFPPRKYWDNIIAFWYSNWIYFSSVTSTTWHKQRQGCFHWSFCPFSSILKAVWSKRAYDTSFISICTTHSSHC